jgi:hypothetical protein
VSTLAESPAWRSLRHRQAALEREVRAGLAQRAGRDAACWLRPLPEGERSDLAALLPAGCPIDLDALCCLDLRFRKLDGEPGFGRLITNARFSASALAEVGPRSGYAAAMSRAADLCELGEQLAELLAANTHDPTGLPLESVLPPSYFAELGVELGVSYDEASMRANNSSGFAARRIQGTDRWSRHTTGAIDLNPFENPMLTVTRAGREAGRGVLDATPEGLRSGLFAASPLGSDDYACDRAQLASKRVIHTDSTIVGRFAQAGWSWGGDWTTLRDYQHFSAGLE